MPPNIRVMAYTRTEKFTLAATIMASSMVFIDGTIVNIALPAIQSDLDVTGSGLLWIVDAYLLTLASLMMAGGALGDTIGRNKVFAAGLILFSLASISCGLSFSPLQLIISRLVQGIGGAMLTPGSLSIIVSHFDGKKAGGAIGLWSMFTSLTSVAGPLLGGFLAESGLWRVIFFINLPLSAVALFFILKKVPETRNDEAGKIDYAGAALITAGLTGLAYAFIESSEKSFGHFSILISLIAGGLILAAFILYEHKSNHPLMPLVLFRSVNFSTSNGITLFLYGALSALTFFLPLNLVQIQGYSEWLGGLVLFPMVLLIAILSPITGNLVEKFSPRIFLIAGPLVTGTGFFIFSQIGQTGGPHEYWRSFFLPTFMMGIGMGITVAPLTTTVMSAVDRKNSGTASGINNSVSRIAGLLAIALLGSYALHHFRMSAEQKIQHVDLPQNQVNKFVKNTADFAATQIPAGVSQSQEEELHSIIHSSFIESFDRVSLASAALAWLSALLAMVFLKRKRKKRRRETG